jgi:predicted Zn-dependent protease
VRYFVLRLSAFFLLLALAGGFGQISAQNAQQQPAASAASHASDQSAQQAPAQAVLDAEAAIVKSDWKSAETALETWLAAHPADARALFDAGYVADAQNRQDDAAGFYRRAVDANPQSFEAHVSFGLLLARQGKLPEARTELAAATALNPGDAGPAAKARAWRALARIDSASDPAEASNDLLEALKLSPETAADTLLAATLADQAGQFDTAESAYRRVLAADPKSAPANAGLAHLLIAHKQYPEAETFLRAALVQSPDDPALTAQLATVLAIENKAEALPLIQKLHDAHPADAAITRMLAEVLAEAGDATGSDHYYIALLAATPDDPALLVAHGQNLIRQLKYAAAFAAFDKATHLDPASG